MTLILMKSFILGAEIIKKRWQKAESESFDAQNIRGPLIADDKQNSRSSREQKWN